ncbi:hypothetical protein [Streptomyces sp. DHE17-7]|uniref:hypothetical protein n=1 Tax=Streptomyces sp. DHE17-7 TaxID=2759949 RepID=UPI0022EA3176|nr:hypothetical protein [Streptomyces sp. DHE17-7]MBJ6617645.1 hypothetical protein [Streptomyces sp. DHE17-7]
MTDHWLLVKAMDPRRLSQRRIEESLRAQVADAVVEWVKILETPRFLTGGRRHSEDEQVMLVTRAALAAPFALSVRTTQHGRSILRGVSVGGVTFTRKYAGIQAWFRPALSKLGLADVTA